MPELQPAAPPPLKLEAAVAQATRAMREAGLESPGREARALVCAATGLGAARLIAEPGLALSGEQQGAFETFLARRLVREPLSRILGRREFFGRTFRITSDTLDPRPETETLIEATLAIVDERGWRKSPIRILDVGTGTGCVVLTLLAELPQARGLGTDIVPGALEVARENAGLVGVTNRVDFRQCRSLEGIEGPFDILVSNPPYIRDEEIPRLDVEVRDFDPRPALSGGADGLAVYRELAAGLDRVVRQGAALFEVGAGQSEQVAALLSAGGENAGSISRLRFWSDLGGHIRCVAMETDR